jgi:hypothetical protein
MDVAVNDGVAVLINYDSIVPLHVSYIAFFRIARPNLYCKFVEASNLIFVIFYRIGK